MSDNIPFEIQMEIVKKVSSVKSVIQFRSVSKQWKSFIDSSEFITGYGARHTHPHSHILSYRPDHHYVGGDLKYICLVDDDVETFKVQQEGIAPFVVSPLIKQCHIECVIGASHGLMCLFGYYNHNSILVIWNPSIGNSFGIALPRHNLRTRYGFGVCPVTSDPTVVKFAYADNMPWCVEVFTLSSGVWNAIPSDSLPRQTVRFYYNTQVAVDKFIYWRAWEKTNADPGVSTMVVSFDLITKEFKVVNLRDTLTNKLFSGVSISKLRGSLAVCGYVVAEVADFGVWVMENNSSFRKLFTIVAPVYPHNILGFKKNGEIIIQTQNRGAEYLRVVLDVYDPCSQQIKSLGISGAYQSCLMDSFFMDSYKESLLLLDHLDSHIYQNDDGYISRGLFCS